MTRVAEPVAERWADPPGEAVSKLILNARAVGWKRAIDQFASQAPSFAARVRDLTLSNWHLLVPHRSTGRALDVGCGFGSLVLGLSQFFSTAVGVELLPSRLAIAGLRSRESAGAAHILKGTGMLLPFAPRLFDLVTLNGVLEWAGLHEAGPPRVLQLRLLREMLRVLGPGGHVAVAIENRFGLEGLLGFRDTHTGIPWVPVLPRPVADAFTRWRVQQPYRTYLYGLRGYVRLFRQAGFPAVRVLDLAPSYNNYQLVIDPDDAVSYRFLARHDLLPGFYPRSTAARAVLGRVLPGSLGRVAYSFLVWGGSDATTVLDDDHPIWYENAMAGGRPSRRFACRGTRVGSLVVIEHDGRRVRRAIELGSDPTPANEPLALPEPFDSRLASGWTEGRAGTAVGLNVRIYTPSS